jgi:hypothetical protein
MRKAVFYPYKMGSQGAHELADALGTFCVYPDKNYRPKAGHLIVNWGSAVFPRWWTPGAARSTLNQPSQVGTAINKLRTFETLHRVGVRVPDFTRDRTQAVTWRDGGAVVVARMSLTGSEGRGIVLVQEREAIPQAPLYTKHVRHRREFRIHVFGNTVIDVAEKRKRTDFPNEEKNPLIRSWRNGWVFAHQNVNTPEDVLTQALQAVQALQLDFGAVDVGYREKEGRAYVFEVNTAPGIEGTTVGAYAGAIRGMLR